MKIMIGGNHTVRELSSKAVQMLDRIIAHKHKVVVGDCTGVDTLVQLYLMECHYENVRVIHIKNHPRYHVGGFQTIQIEGKRQTDKDKAMIHWCDVALLIFHSNCGTGTKRNLEELQRLGKKAVVVQNEADTYQVV